MKIKKYQEEASRTFASRKKPLDKVTLDLLHCAIGASTEANELLDAFKKKIYYGKSLDVVNVKEEIGDQLWYIVNICRLLNIDIEEIMQININKLKKRFPEKFTNEKALNRDLKAERIVLSSKKR